MSFSSNVVCATSKGSDQPAHTRSRKSHAYSMTVKLLTEQLLEFLSLIVGCICSYESTLVKMPHCWKSHVEAPMFSMHVCCFVDRTASIIVNDLRNTVSLILKYYFSN